MPNDYFRKNFRGVFLNQAYAFLKFLILSSPFTVTNKISFTKLLRETSIRILT